METEENNKKNLKLSPKHFVLKAGRNMVDKIKNFAKQVAENYKNGFTYVSDRPGREQTEDFKINWIKWQKQVLKIH